MSFVVKTWSIQATFFSRKIWKNIYIIYLCPSFQNVFQVSNSTPWRWERRWSMKRFGYTESGSSTRETISHWSTDNTFKLVSVLVMVYACCFWLLHWNNLCEQKFLWTGASLNMLIWPRIRLGVLTPRPFYCFLTKHKLWRMPTPDPCCVRVGVCFFAGRRWGVQKVTVRVFQGDTVWRQQLL